MIDDEFIGEDLDDQETVRYIQEALPQELKQKYPEDTLYYILDVINDYFSTSGVLDAAPDADGFIEIDNEAVAAYIVKEAKRDGMGDFDPDEILLIVEAEADYVDGLEQ
ncbi:MAG: hypothetical protein J5732_05185 [Bacteroidaceae bacterium]|nr:hypothetical protein [Bacteroidaceae bacterium]